MKENYLSIKLFVLILFISLFVENTSAQSNREYQGFSQDTFIHHVEAISHDSTEGRATPSSGLEATANYIAHHFQQSGLIPFGDEGTYFQKYPLKEMSIDKDKSVITNLGSSLRWKYIDDFTRRGGGGIFRPGESTGKLVVIAGHNLDMEKIASANLAGKIVLYIQPEDINEKNPSAGIINVFRIASQGAQMVLMSSLRTEEQWSRVKDNPESYLTSYTEPGWQKPQDRKNPNPSFFEVKSSTVNTFLTTLGLDYKKLSNPDKDFFLLQNYEDEMTVNINVKTDHIAWPSNVVGLIEGSDPKLKNEFVVYTAHYDHLGFVKGDNSDDNINNGADDNASGTAALMMLADVFSRLPEKPRRSVLFNAVSGEEIGLIGSEYFVKKFPQAKQRIVANINADMIGSAFRSDTLFALGMEYTSLGSQLATLNRTFKNPLALLNTAQTDSMYKGQELFRRSDHFNFLQEGIPSLFFFTGLHEQYHDSGDEVEILNEATSIKIIQLMYQLGLETANAPAKPFWNLDPEKIKYY